MNFKEHLEKASELLEQGLFSEAIAHYEKARRLAPTPSERLDITTFLSTLYQVQKNSGKAREVLQEALEYYQSNLPDLSINQAVIYNHLGQLSLPKNPKRAILYFKEAVQLFRDLQEQDPKYHMALARSLFNFGEAYQQIEKYYYAKKFYRECLELLKASESEEALNLQARTHYQLGAIYHEAFNPYDARTNYLQALRYYDEKANTDFQGFGPLKAATLNNLALTAIEMEDYGKAEAYYKNTLEVYQDLSLAFPETYLPFVGATCTHLGILFGTQKDYAAALLYTQKAHDIYEKLSAETPEFYLHYLATALHNKGVFHLENQEYHLANENFSGALKLRKKLYEVNPEAFRADFSATAINLVETYEILLDETGSMQMKQQGMELLLELEPVIQELAESPVEISMKNDWMYLRNYFESVDEQMLHTRQVIKEVRHLEEEVDSTLNLHEKMEFQKKIITLLNGLCNGGDDRTVIRQSLMKAYVNLSWFYLREGDTLLARQCLEQAQSGGQISEALICNLGHCFLLEGKRDQAQELYASLEGKYDANGKPYSEIIQEDLDILLPDGVLRGLGYHSV